MGVRVHCTSCDHEAPIFDFMTSELFLSCPKCKMDESGLVTNRDHVTTENES